jgi:hypothetical protein
MLAQNFLTAKDLYLSDKFHSQLITLLGRMERGEFVHVGENEFPLVDKPEWKGRELFNMEQIYLRGMPCGTVGCMWGWATAGETAFGLSMTVSQRNLFMTSPQWRSVREQITVDQAASALRNFLTTGEANWADMVPGLKFDKDSGEAYIG